jgi:hypothetical protein
MSGYCKAGKERTKENLRERLVNGMNIIVVRHHNATVRIQNILLGSQGNPTRSAARSVAMALRAESHIYQRTAAPTRWQKFPPS